MSPQAGGWRQVLEGAGPAIRLGAPATGSDVEECGRFLGIALPEDLAAFLRVTGGFFHVAGQWQCAWGWRQIAEENLQLWGSELLDRRFLAFGHNGSDEEFCFDLDSTGRREVVAWSSIGGEVVHRWSSLDQFWADWLRHA